jgi:hypothetical protein
MKEMMMNREEVEKILIRTKKMKDLDRIVHLLEIVVELLIDLRFGDKEKG